MVFHLFERVFGTYGDPKTTFWQNRTSDYLVENGFSEKEAEALSWLSGLQNNGKFFGIVGGLWVYWVGRPVWAKMRKTNPRFLYQPYWNPILKVTVVVAGYFVGDYISTSSLRRGAEDQISSLYNNNAFLKNKEALVRSFEPLNRKFTDEEIHQFYVNKYRKESHERRWIYNPYIHGEKEDYERLISNAESRIPASEQAQVKAKIAEENREKIAAGEIVQDKPYNITDFVDVSGERTVIQRFPLLKGWRPLA